MMSRYASVEQLQPGIINRIAGEHGLPYKKRLSTLLKIDRVIRNSGLVCVNLSLGRTDRQLVLFKRCASGAK